MNIYTSTEICLFFYLIVAVLGLTGNALAFVVFSGSRFRRTIFSIYFRFNLVIDSYVIANALVDFVNDLYEINIESTSAIICYMRQYLMYVLAATSAWLYVIVSLYRMLDVVAPGVVFFKQTLTQIVICVVLLCYNGCLYVPIPTSFIHYGPPLVADQSNLSAACNNCTPTQADNVCMLNFKSWLTWTDMFNSTIVPFAFMVIFNAIAIITIFKHKKKITNNPTAAANINKRSVKYGLVIVLMCLCFLVLNLPITVVNVLSSTAQSSDNSILGSGSLFALSVVLLWYANYGIIFYMNALVNTLFRAELWHMLTVLTCRRPSSKPATRSTH